MRAKHRPSQVELGFPAVVKTAEPGAHKTEHGGVALDLATPGMRRLAAERNRRAAHRATDDRGWRRATRRFRPGSRFWATLAAFGPGGVQAEFHRRGAPPACPGRRHRRPSSSLEARPAASSQASEGHLAADADALVDLVARLARLGEDHAEVAELDLNPYPRAGDRLRGGRCARPDLLAHLPGHPEDLVAARSSAAFPQGVQRYRLRRNGH